jgi:hypothetical protein
MRQLLFGFAMALAAGTAGASSIEIVGSAPQAGESILVEKCGSCPPLKTAERKRDYTVPTLAPGFLQENEIRNVNGEMKLYRTEGWIGGSPVVFVTTATPDAVAAFDTQPSPSIVGVDPTATTSGIEKRLPVAAGMASPEQKPVLDISQFKLRD